MDPRLKKALILDEFTKVSYRVKTSNLGRFFAVSLLQHGLCFAPDMSPS